MRQRECDDVVGARHGLWVVIISMLTALALLLVACSPEEDRRRGEAGADVGNKPSEPAEVDLHGKENPDLDVPNLLPPAEQTANR